MAHEYMMQTCVELELKLPDSRGTQRLVVQGFNGPLNTTDSQASYSEAVRFIAAASPVHFQTYTHSHLALNMHPPHMYPPLSLKGVGALTLHDPPITHDSIEFYKNTQNNKCNEFILNLATDNHLS